MFSSGILIFSRFDRRNHVSMDSAVRREDRTVRRGLPASLEHVAAGAPLTCGLTTELTNNVPHRSACRLHPQVGAAVNTKQVLDGDGDGDPLKRRGRTCGAKQGE